MLREKTINWIQFKLGKVGYKICLSLNKVVEMDERFLRFYELCKPFTMTSREKMYTLYKSVCYIVQNRIPGDLVECGVWKGGSSMLIALTLKELGDETRNIWLYDTFEGMTPPTEEDKRIEGKATSVLKKWRGDQRQDHNAWCYAPFQEVETNMASTKYPLDKIKLIKGPVEESIPVHIPYSTSLLRLDTDWYASTKHELVHLYPTLSANGVLILDDYGYWSGSKQAADEYFNHDEILLTLIDAGGAVGIKPSI
ncbi:MAG: class I SAM-dependent methyltransferase [Flavobacteriales bacterium]|nr:class I SAM-dependent methyltransferase [Flavobacteriales bacterium]